jgi:hypothetical protein
MATTVFLGERIPEAVESNIIEVDGLVGQRFENAITMAAQSWGLLQDVLTSLGGIDMQSMDWEGIEIEDVSGDLANIFGGRPSIDSIDEYVRRLLEIEIPEFPEYQVPPLVDFSQGALDVNNAIHIKFLDLVENGGTGLGAVVEQMIWDRMRGRQETENARQWLEAENYFAGRGFDLPPGALSGKLNEIAIEIGRNNANTNNDITVEQARLAQTNTHFYLSEAYKATTVILDGEVKRLVDSNKSMYEMYVSKLEGIKVRVSALLGIIEAIAKIISARVQLYQADVMLGSAMADLTYKVQELRTRINIAGAEITLKQMQMAIEEVKNIVALKVEAMKSAAQALSQICASALTSVNASASMGVSTTVGESASIDVKYAYSESKSEEHQITETKE